MEWVLIGIGVSTLLYVLADIVGVLPPVTPKQSEFAKRFPPISDAEFLALCTPETDPQIALRVRKVLSDIYSVDENRIYPTARLIDDLEW